MPKSMQEYMAWLDTRTDLVWPQAPRIKAVAAQPHLKPLSGIRAVVWNLYGTLVRITDGDLLLCHHQEMRMQVAMEKTINEFRMWNSMTRKPVAPWEYLLPKYRGIVESMEVSPPQNAGDFSHVNSQAVWRTILDLLAQKEYAWDREFYGPVDQLAEKVAYFFQASLQGVEAAPNAVAALSCVAGAGLVQGVLADAQSFSILQMLRVLGRETKLSPLADLFDPACLVLSSQVGVRKPSPTLYRTCLDRFAAKGIAPNEILYVGSRLQGDLAVAKQLGMRTALYAGDGNSLKASGTEIRHKDLRPRRLLTDLKQIRSLIVH